MCQFFSKNDWRSNFHPTKCHWLTSTPKKRHVFGMVYCLGFLTIFQASIQRLREGINDFKPSKCQTNHPWILFSWRIFHHRPYQVSSLLATPEYQPGGRMLKRGIKSCFQPNQSMGSCVVDGQIFPNENPAMNFQNAKFILFVREDSHASKEKRITGW